MVQKSESLSWGSYWKDYQYMCGYEQQKATRLVAYLHWLKHKFSWWICSHAGHDLVDESYGTSESGAESGYCRRCGWSYHVRMY